MLGWFYPANRGIPSGMPCSLPRSVPRSVPRCFHASAVLMIKATNRPRTASNRVSQTFDHHFPMASCPRAPLLSSVWAARQRASLLCRLRLRLERFWAIDPRCAGNNCVDPRAVCLTSGSEDQQAHTRWLRRTAVACFLDGLLVDS